MSDIANGIQSHSSYFNEAGEPLMTAAEARREAYIDEQAWAERDYDEHYEDRYDAFMEDAYDRQCSGQCPACGEYECDRDLVCGGGSERKAYVYHKAVK